MRVLFITHEDDQFGSPKSMMEMIKRLMDEYDVEPVVITSKRNAVNSECRELGIENYTFNYKWFMSSKEKPGLKFVSEHFSKCREYFSMNRKSISEIMNITGLDTIDLVHTNTSVLDVGAEIAKRLEVPHIWHLREFGKEDFNLYSLKPGHINYMNRNTTYFIAISNAVASVWDARGIDEEKIKVIYNGLSKEQYYFPRSDLYDPDKKVEILFAGSLSPRKGQEEILEALRLLPDEIKNAVRVDFAGSGDPAYEKKLRDFVDDNRLDPFVRFLGYQTDLPSIYPNYDLGVICSKSEAFGRVTVEYMLSGLCVIASSTGANGELVENGKSGLLYEYGNPADLASKIEFLLNNRELIKEFGLKGQKLGLQKYTSVINAREVYNLYQEVMEERQAATGDRTGETV